MPQRARPKRKQLNQAELIATLRSHLPELRERHGVRALAIFGSYARGEARRGSDLDLLVEFERVPSLFEFVEIEQSLSDLLGVKVDLVMKDALRPAIGRHTKRTGAGVSPARGIAIDLVGGPFAHW